jgi:hypothetical protein
VLLAAERIAQSTGGPFSNSAVARSLADMPPGTVSGTLHALVKRGKLIKTDGGYAMPSITGADVVAAPEPVIEAQAVDENREAVGAF